MNHKTDETKLLSNRIMLRPYQEHDIQDFYNLICLNTARLAPSFPGRMRVITSPDEARKLILQFKSDWVLGQTYAFGVWRIDNAGYIGDISLKSFDYSVPKAEIGYYLDLQAEGCGYGIEMLQTLVDFAFQQLKLNKLFIRCSTQNNRSCRLAERCGFYREGLMRQDFRDHQKQLIDIYYYGLTRQDYDKLAQNKLT